MGTKRRGLVRIALLAILFCAPLTQTLAVCYPEYENCGYDFEYWLALNYPQAYGDPTDPDFHNFVFCDAQLEDAIGRPAAGYRVQLYVAGSYSQTDGVSGYTDENGHVRLQIHKGPDFGMYYARCRAFDADNNYIGPVESTSELGPNGRLISPLVLQLGHTTPDMPDLEIATPEHVAHFPGLEDGRARMELYQSGIYDKVMIFVPPFDTAEGTGEERTIPRLILMMQQALIAMQPHGVDIWMFKPWHTYDDLHEQAAELAQAIEYARNYAQGTGNQKVTVVGMSTGGLVAKIATARWEDPGEAAWRAAWAAAVELTDPPDSEVPVSLLGLIESPLRGANVNQELQELAWEHGFAAERQLDSCGALQMLTTSCLPQRDHPVAGFDYPCTSARSADFFGGDGGPIVWDFTPFDPSPVTLCTGGPAVWSINGDGYPHAPTVIAASNGLLGQRNRCYGTEGSPSPRDVGLGGNVCPHSEHASNHQLGDDYLKIAIGPWWPDQHVEFRPWDVAPGSRWDTIIDYEGERWGLIDWEMVQRGTTTFVAMTSSMDVDGCDPFHVGDPYNVPNCVSLAYDETQGGVLARHLAIDDSRTNPEFMGTHGNLHPSIIQWLVGHVVAAVLTDYQVPPDPPEPDRPGTDGSCALRCGDSQPSGDCFCDAACEDNDDCCADYAGPNVDPAAEFQGCRPAPECGDGICESFSGWETQASCCWDCGVCGPVCGDGECEEDETHSTCPADCPDTSPTCVKGVCINESP